MTSQTHRYAVRSCAWASSRLGFGLAVLLACETQVYVAVAQPAASTIRREQAPNDVSGSAQTGVRDATSAFVVPFEKYVLDNGLTVILHRDARQNNVAVNVWYHAGPVNDPPLRSGFAHLFEHLMFEGSKYAGRKFDSLLEAAGGTNMNGTTNWDRTNYFETVPSEHLELALWLESDRMGFMIDAVTQERLDVQREVVKNERRESLENQPDGPSYLALMDALFPPGHPYNGAVIGSMEDLSRATLQDVHAFFHNYYAPANATLTLAGNFDPAQAKAWVKRYFGSLLARSVNVAPKRADVPAACGARLVVNEPVELSRVTWAWRTPPAYSASDAPLQLAARMLAGGKASRLERALVKSGLANEVSAAVDPNRLASSFIVQVRLASGVTVARAEQVLARELARLADAGPTEDELARARASLKVSTASDLQLLNSADGEGGRAGVLQRLNYYVNDPGALPRVMQVFDATTATQVKLALGEHLTDSQRIVVVTEPRLADPTNQSVQQ